MNAIPLQGTPDWYAWRRNGIGASEIPAILGEDPYMGEYELALEKRGLTERSPENDAQRWGKRVQRTALEMVAESRGWTVRNVNTTAVSRRFPHVYASLDGRHQGQRRGIEVKLAREKWEDEPPRRVQIQCQTQMGVHEFEAIDVVKVAPYYSEPLVFTVERDDILIAKLLPLGEKWYDRYVLGDELPPVDGSRAASRHLDRQEGPPEMQADIDQAALAARLQAIRRTLKTAEAEESEVINRLKESMHGSYALVGHGFKVAWKPSKPRTTTDWKLVAKAYRDVLEMAGEWDRETLAVHASTDYLDTLVSLHSATGEGTRPFRVTFEEEDHD